MATALSSLLPAGLLELAQFDREFLWPAAQERLDQSGHPTNEGDPDPDPDPDPQPDPDPDPDPQPDPEPDPERVKRDDDWQTKSRKNESRAKRAERERDELKQRLEKIEGQSKTEHEKALELARKEARDEALSEAEKERRADRLEVAVTRLAARGITIGEGDDVQTVKFADPEDALLNVERAINRGEIDADDIYDSEGKVDNAALTTALSELASAKPHLLTDADAERPKPKGDPGTRKGSPASTDLEAMSPEDHARRKYGATK